MYSSNYWYVCCNLTKNKDKLFSPHNSLSLYAFFFQWFLIFDALGFFKYLYVVGEGEPMWEDASIQQKHGKLAKLQQIRLSLPECRDEIVELFLICLFEVRPVHFALILKLIKFSNYYISSSLFLLICNIHDD